MSPLALLRLAVGVALVALGFPGRVIGNGSFCEVVLEYPKRNPLGLGRGIRRLLPPGCLRLDAGLLLGFQSGALGLPFLPGRSDGAAFLLPRQAGRLGGFPGGAVGLQESGFRTGCGAAPGGEIVLFRMSHVGLP